MGKICEFYEICKENHKYHCKHIEELELKGAYCMIKKEIQRKKDLERQLELETIAKNKYCEATNWSYIIDMLSEDDKEEYLKLVKKGGF